MAVQVVDSSNLVSSLQAEADAQAAEDAAVEAARAPTKPAAPASESTKADSKPTEPAKAADPTTPDPDDIEGEDGLTPRQKREWTKQMQKTVGKKHREMKEAEEFAAAQYAERTLAERRVAELEHQLQTAKPVQQVAAAEAKPERQNFQTDDEYVKATVKWEVAQAIQADRAERERIEQERKQAEVMAAAKERIAKALELVPDFEEVTSANDAEVPPYIAGYMQESEMFAELGYYLAKHPDQLVRLGKMTPARQLVEIGKIESTLKPFSAVEPPAPATNTNGSPSPSAPNGTQATAPAPSETGTVPSKARVTAPVITPLNGQGTATDLDPRTANTREMISDWAKRNQANFRLRKRH